jgi:YggT family protein
VAFICLLLNLYIWVIIARSLISYARVVPGTPLARVNSFLVGITEPVLRPVRNVLPPMRMGAGAIDLSPIAVIVVIIVICSAAG